MVSLRKILNKHSGLAAFTTATALTLTNANPSFALDLFKFGFCGTFSNGGTVNGYLQVDKDGIFNATQITTTGAGGADVRTYTVADFSSFDNNATATDGLGGPSFAAYKYTFKYDSLSLATDRFEAYLPASFFPISINGGADGGKDFATLPVTKVSQIEYRNNVPLGDPDDITPVPWETDALPVVGSTILFGCGVWLKRKSANAHKKDLG
jgi:hypothetical protein